MGLWDNNVNIAKGAQSLIKGATSTIKNTNISSVLMTAASMYFGSKNKIEWYFSPATNYTRNTSVVNESGVITLPTNSPLVTDSVLPKAFFIEMSISHNGQAVGAPIEEGSYTIYNKTTEPMNINATLAFDENKGAYNTINWQGLKTSIERHQVAPTINEVISRLITLKKSPITFNIVTPYCEYENMTLESYDYAFKREDGRGVLFVNCKFKEIPQVKVITLTPEKVKSPTCAATQKAGTVTPDKRNSLAYDADKKGLVAGVKRAATNAYNWAKKAVS